MGNCLSKKKRIAHRAQSMEKGMIKRVKNKIIGKISNKIGAAVRKEIYDLLPIIAQLIKFQNSSKEDRQSCYDHTKS